VPIAHAQFTCKRNLPLFGYDGCFRGAFRILVSPTSGGSRLLGGILTNLYWSVSTVTVPSWRCGFLSWRVEYVSSEHYCQAEVFCSWYRVYANCGAIGVIASTTYMTMVELFDEYHLPLLPWDDDDCHWSQHQHLCWIYYQSKQKETPKLAVEVNRSWSRSTITTILLPFWLRNPTRTQA